MQNNLGLWENPKDWNKEREWSDIIGLVTNMCLLLVVSFLSDPASQGAFYIEDENIVLKLI